MRLSAFLYGVSEYLRCPLDNSVLSVVYQGVL